MADNDDLGNFFDEINQIEETADVGEPKTAMTSESAQPYISSKSVAPELNHINHRNLATSSVISKQPELQTVSKATEFVAVNRAVYTYGIASTLDNSSTEPLSDVQESDICATSSSTFENSASSSSSNRHSSIGPSIGPIGPPTGPRPPSGAPSHSYPQHSSGGLNLSLHSFSTSYVTSSVPAPQMPKQDKTFVRTGAGEIWVDDSLKDWPENDYRIFVGDLGKETTTEMLAKIFQPYKSFAKAKVIRTKHENKARGFGFVSFMDPMDCARAIREMQGKYLGTRPMKITRSKWDELDIKQVKKKEQKKRKLQESLGL